MRALAQAVIAIILYTSFLLTVPWVEVMYPPAYLLTHLYISIHSPFPYVKGSFFLSGTIPGIVLSDDCVLAYISLAALPLEDNATRPGIHACLDPSIQLGVPSVLPYKSGKRVGLEYSCTPHSAQLNAPEASP